MAAKKYEKDRRIRFNALLDRLASVLPGCPVGNPDNKWTKAQVNDEKINGISVQLIQNIKIGKIFAII